MKADSLPIDLFLSHSAEKLIIDVRSPIEFTKGHVPGAINIPLFDDLERAEIGTLYKAKGKEEAVMKGLELVSPKLTELIRQAKENTKTNDVYVYCARGGMRSNSFGWLLNTAGLKVKIMQGGYKAYRNFVLSRFEKPYKLLLLGGATGSGKTEVLYELNNKIQVLDLEGLAHHKGSAFGGINQPPQLPQQLFENEFFAHLSELDPAKFILAEDESMSIGYNKIPYPFWLQMKNAAIIKLIVPFELRVKRLVNEYGTSDKALLVKSIKNISQQIGWNNYKKCIRLLEEGQLADVAAIALMYYDKAYEYNHNKKEKSFLIPVETDTDDAKINAEKVKQAFDCYGRN